MRSLKQNPSEKFHWICEPGQSDECRRKKTKCPRCCHVFTVEGKPEASVYPCPSAQPTKPCPFCGETILATAVKCRHCQSLLTNDTSGFVPQTPAYPPQVSPTPQGYDPVEFERRYAQVALAVTVVFGIIVYLFLNHLFSAPSGHARRTVSPSACTEADLDRMVRDYHDNSIRANSTWRGKAVRVRGTVAYIAPGRVDISIPNAGPDGILITCFFQDDVKGKLEALNVGSEITVCGEVDSLGETYLIFDHCDLY